MNYNNGYCLSCRYDIRDEKIRALEKIMQLLETQNLSSTKNHRRFNWGQPNNCKIRLSCSKTEQNKRKFNQLTDILDNLLSAYIEKGEFDNYQDILFHLRGNFTIVYRELNTAYIKNLNK